MNGLTLNLLRHAGAPGDRAMAARRPVRLALLAGLLAGGLWGGWQHMRLEQLRQTQAALEARWQSSGAPDQQQLTLRRQWAQRAQAWQLQRDTLIRLQQQLDTQAAESGLRLQRWQGDARQRTLQAVLPSPHTLPTLLAALKVASQQDWLLDQLATPSAADEGRAVEVVLKTVAVPAPAASGVARP